MANDLAPAELRHLLTALAERFKSLGVTSILTLESQSLYAADGITDRGFSPVVDNVILVRYTQLPGELRPTIVVVKSRGSAHDWGTYYFTITVGGVHILQRADAVVKTAKKRVATQTRRKR
jgi:circadian clock protein KaiC